MLKFPFVCVDNFYPDPYKIRDFALEQNFTKTTKGGFPGKRTKGIEELDIKLFNYFNARLFSIFYDFDFEKLNWTVNTTFDINKNESEGYIHTDGNSTFVGLIYLSPEANLKSGTNFFIKNQNYNQDYMGVEDKVNYFKNNTEENKERYLKSKEQHNNMFTQSMEIKNVFNRLIAYDPSIYHAPAEIYEQERLIQVFHVEKFDAKLKPLERMRRYD
jgi:hypothetical protein